MVLNWFSRRPYCYHKKKLPTFVEKPEGKIYIPKEYKFYPFYQIKSDDVHPHHVWWVAVFKIVSK
mgnify:FL=1